MDADEAGRNIAVGDFVHGFAVDDDFNGIAAADSLKRAPFADRAFSGWLEHFNPVLFHVLWLGAINAAPEPEITLMGVHALTLDAPRPDIVGQMHVNEYAGVAGLEEAPLDGADIIAVNIFRAHKAIRPAGAMDDAIRDAPGLFRR